MLKRILTDDKNLQLIQDNVEQALTPLQSSAMSDSALVGPFTLITAQDNLVKHKQGKPIQYWVLAGQNSNATVWSPVTSKLKNSNGVAQSSDAAFLNLQCSANCIVSLVVG